MSIRKRAGNRLLLAAVVAASLGACGSGQLGGQPADLGMSPGTVSFQLTLPSSRSFCEPLDVCRQIDHFAFFTAAGAPLQTSPGWCPIICSDQCAPPPCLPCGPEGGLEVDGLGTAWQGAIYEASTCGTANLGCVRERFVAAGRYVVRMCATPSTLAPSDTGVESCTATGPEECVEVPFDIPGPPVTATLPP